MAMFEQKDINTWVDEKDRLVASKVFTLRTRAGIERDDLAEVIGIDEAVLSDYELGKAPIPASDLSLISAVFGVKFEYFYDEEESALKERVIRLKEGQEENEQKHQEEQAGAH